MSTTIGWQSATFSENIVNGYHTPTYIQSQKLNCFLKYKHLKAGIGTISFKFRKSDPMDPKPSLDAIQPAKAMGRKIKNCAPQNINPFLVHIPSSSGISSSRSNLPFFSIIGLVRVDLAYQAIAVSIVSHQLRCSGRF